MQKLHREQGLKRVVGAADPEAAEALNGHAMDEPFEFEHEHEGGEPAMAGDKLARLRRALRELEAAKAMLDALLGG